MGRSGFVNRLHRLRANKAAPRLATKTELKIKMTKLDGTVLNDITLGAGIAANSTDKSSEPQVPLMIQGIGAFRHTSGVLTASLLLIVA
jgi:hypothetical protein